MKINFFNESSLKTRSYEKLISKVFKSINSKKTFLFKTTKCKKERELV